MTPKCEICGEVLDATGDTARDHGDGRIIHLDCGYSKASRLKVLHGDCDFCDRRSVKLLSMGMFMCRACLSKALLMLAPETGPVVVARAGAEQLRIDGVLPMAMGHVEVKAGGTFTFWPPDDEP